MKSAPGTTSGDGERSGRSSMMLSAAERPQTSLVGRWRGERTSYTSFSCSVPLSSLTLTSGGETCS